MLEIDYLNGALFSQKKKIHKDTNGSHNHTHMLYNFLNYYFACNNVTIFVNMFTDMKNIDLARRGHWWLVIVSGESLVRSVLPTPIAADDVSNEHNDDQPG